MFYGPEGKEGHVLAVHPPLFAFLIELLCDFCRYTNRHIRLVRSKCKNRECPSKWSYRVAVDWSDLPSVVVQGTKEVTEEMNTYPVLQKRSYLLAI